MIGGIQKQRLGRTVDDILFYIVVCYDNRIKYSDDDVDIFWNITKNSQMLSKVSQVSSIVYS